MFLLIVTCWRSADNRPFARVCGPVCPWKNLKEKRQFGNLVFELVLKCNECTHRKWCPERSESGWSRRWHRRADSGGQRRSSRWRGERSARWRCRWSSPESGSGRRTSGDVGDTSIDFLFPAAKKFSFNPNRQRCCPIRALPQIGI